ncbi:MAG TPA: hypothetical protein DEA78_21705, partial [Cyanobacteria bacterium UBA11159]|nr:hypothetical protein [Cyanobacteria bacterium UBA11159]
IYNTVMFFIERGAQIAALGEAVFSSIGSIAAGNIGAAANYVEQTMGRTLPVVISFLARLMGLGGISEQIKSLIKKVQGKVEDAVSRVVDFVVEKGKSLLGGGGGTNSAQIDPNPDQKVQEGLRAIDTEDRRHRQDGKITKENAQKVASNVKNNYSVFNSITVIDGVKNWNYDYVIARSKITGGEKAEGNQDEDINRAKTAFGKDTFSTQQLMALLGGGLRTAQRKVKKWTENPEVYGCYLVPGTRDQYTFDRDKVLSSNPQEGKHPSMYVDSDTWEILPKYRKDMRDRFYKKRFRDDMRAEVLRQAYAGTDKNGTPLYRCYNTDYTQLQGPNHKELSPYGGQGGAQIDHIGDVVDHWKDKEGNNMTQEQRNDWYDNPDNLRILCESCNKAKKGKSQGRFIFKVGLNFRGPNEE